MHDEAGAPDRIMSQVMQVLARHVPPGTVLADIGRDVALVSIGVDSMRSIDLLMDLETDLALNFPDELLVPDNFRTIATLCATVETLLRAGSRP